MALSFIILTLALFPPPASGAPALATFSAGIAESKLNATEQTLLNYTAVGAAGGALTYFWITGGPPVAQAVIRMFVDGEALPSLAFEPAKAAGMGFLNASHAGDRDLPPWGSRWMGSLGRNAYHLTFRVPFMRSLRITFQAGAAGGCAVWLQARGSEGLALDHMIPGVTLPPTARLVLQARELVAYRALDYMTIADVPRGTSGAVFLSTVWWTSLSPNTIEGCWRAFTPRDAAFPGLQLSTGWEDYYAASWGFAAGPFTTSLAGNTFYTSPGNLQVSAYRFHDLDPLFFSDGLKLVMRNGETVDGDGIKCRLETGGKPHGSPSNTTLSSYAWLYTW